MSSSEPRLTGRRGVLALLGVLPLAACGFTPVYGPGGAGDRLRETIAFAEPANVPAFNLVSRLEDRLGRAAAPVYRLDYRITTSQSSLGVTGAFDVTRINLIGDVNFTVTEIATGRTLQTGDVSTFTAYATSGSPVATLAARRDAEARLMTALADQIVTRLMAGAAGWP
jgi:LPS-assembly lipoprotein